ncbi:MAG: hypothetical protein M5U34_13275 [Chloroflexi bacterium]|nr:hypothetical protein [Chloroflexota bacterium]
MGSHPLTWSPDGRFLAYTTHNSEDPDETVFDSWVMDTVTGVNGRFVENAGMWAHLNWAGSANVADPIAFLRTTNPLDSQRSSYTLWLMDQDGSNAHQIYPAANENSYFPRQQRFMAWGQVAARSPCLQQCPLPLQHRNGRSPPPHRRRRHQLPPHLVSLRRRPGRRIGCRQRWERRSQRHAPANTLGDFLPEEPRRGE